jgi:hypothetical protein
MCIRDIPEALVIAQKTVNVTVIYRILFRLVSNTLTLVIFDVCPLEDEYSELAFAKRFLIFLVKHLLDIRCQLAGLFWVF